uniref:Uncharacterized protein n=1 Tax=Brassica campestris TaxID=3711 RepID=A0A3P5Z0Z9_BRACM|nr:unnamed protein product [Brassica rapa]
MDTYTKMHEEAAIKKSLEKTYMEEIFSKFVAVQSLIKMLPDVAPRIGRTSHDSYVDTFSQTRCPDRNAKKLSFPNMRMYDGTSASDNHVTQYKQRMFTIAIAKEFQEATMCMRFCSPLTRSALNSISTYLMYRYTPFQL